MIRPLAAVLFLWAVVHSPAARADAAKAEPLNVPTSKIDEIFARWDKPSSPGMAVAVIREGSIIYQRGYGMANLELDVPLSPDSVFYIASTSKQFTAASIAILARQGKISLDDDVRKHIPELPDYGTPITIRHLIHHTSGLRDYGALMVVSGRGEEGFTLDDVLQIIVRQKELNAPPGQEYSYTNSGYSLMAEIVKRASGKTLRQFANEHIFRPLGMTQTVFRDHHRMIIKHRAVGYESMAGGFLSDDPATDAVGPGNLWTTVGDLFLWDQNFYHNQLGDGLVEELLTPGKLANGEPLDYAFGLTVDKYKGLARVHHGGAFMGFRTEFVRFPDQRLSVIVLSNLDSVDPHSLALKVADLYLTDRFVPKSAAAEPPQVKLAPETLAALAGTFRDPRDGALSTFVVQDNSLSLVRLTPNRFKLRPASETMFWGTGAVEGLRCEFLAAKVNGPRQVRFGYEGGRLRMLDEVTVVSPTADELKDYAGKYYSEEAQAAYSFHADKARLLLDTPQGRRLPLRATIRDEFASSDGTIQFERGAKGQVEAFRLHNPRALRVLFVRQADN